MSSAVMWERLDAPARRVMMAALDSAEELGHLYIGDEHLLLGLLGASDADAGGTRRFLERHGLDLASARTELVRLTADGKVPRLRRDHAADLHTVGVDVGQVAHQLTASFGAEALSKAICRASYRPGAPTPPRSASGACRGSVATALPDDVPPSGQRAEPHATGAIRAMVPMIE